MRFGAVAQLGERELCKLEVVGSIPIGSTILPPDQVRGLVGKPFIIRRRNVRV
jgi:hypothetical protein